MTSIRRTFIGHSEDCPRYLYVFADGECSPGCTWPRQPEVAEARRIVDAHECSMHGHDWDFTRTMGRVYPSTVFCRRDCGVPPAPVVPPETGGSHG